MRLPPTDHGVILPSQVAAQPVAPQDQYKPPAGHHRVQQGNQMQLEQSQQVGCLKFPIDEEFLAHVLCFACAA
jgi:hypothetical protein